MNKKKKDRPAYRRRKFLVNKKLQMALAIPLLAVLAGIAICYFVAMVVLPGADAMSGMAVEDVRSILLKTNLIYFALATAMIAVVALLMTHRIAGPLYVIEKAIRAIRAGNYKERLSLRRRDFLKPLAGAVAGLRSDLQERDQQRERLADELERCIEAGDLDAVRQVADKLRGKAAKATETATPAAAAQ